MKYTDYFKKLSMLFICTLFICSSAFAQGKLVSVDLKNSSLQELFSVIEEQTSYNFSYRDVVVSKAKDITISKKDVPVGTLLTDVLKSKGLGFDIVSDKSIVINEMSVAHVAQSTKKTLVSGKVLEANGSPVYGAIITIKGTTTATVSGLDGEFAINATPSDVLSTTFVGYQDNEMQVGSKTKFVVVLESSQISLDEVVVVGYGKVKKVNLTGAVSSVKMDKVLGDRPLGSVSSALQGAIPGLQITSGNSHPGTALKINVRGTNSINGGEPLILVDNIPMSIDMVNPADIETFTVLKDAASSAIYGARAAFGVILITTKQGRKGEGMKMNYSANFSFSQPYNLPTHASPYDAVKGLKDAGQVSDASLGLNVDNWLGYLEDYNANPSKYPEGFHIDENGSKYYLQQNDLIGDMIDNAGFQHMHNFSISGSTDKSIYRLSLGILNEDGILYSDKDVYRRYNVSSYISSDINDWLQVQADVKYANSNSEWVKGGIRQGLWGSAMTTPSYFPLEGVVEDGVYYPSETSRSAIGYEDPVRKNTNNLRTIGRVIITPIKDLTFTGEYSFTYNNERKVDSENIVTYATPTGELRPNRKNSSYKLDKNSSINHTLNIFANYSKDFGKHHISVMGGYNQEDYDYENSWMKKLDVINSSIPSIGQSTGLLTGADDFSQYSTRSLFYRANYSYAGKYLFETSGRYDGSSKFPTDTRFGFFPSASLGWLLSEESFMDWSNSSLSNLKLRYSYGEIGNQSIAPYSFIPEMGAYISDWLVNGGQVTSLKPPGLVSNLFTWESVATSNFGIDVGLFKQKLEMSFDYYIRNTRDMLAPGMELPSVAGADAPKENVADLQTKGWELTASYRDRIGEFGYRIGVNISDSKTVITKFDNEVGLLTSGNKNTPVNYVGRTMGEIWGYETDRFYTEDDFDASGKIKPGIAVVKGVIPNPGDILYVDQNGDGIIDLGENTLTDPGDQKIIGNDSRRYQYGANIDLDWKGINLSIFMQGVASRDVWRNNPQIFPFHSEFSTIFDHQLDYWTPENTNAFYPRLYERAAGNTSANRKTQTKYMLNGSYFRLKNISVSYTLPARWYRDWGVSKVNVFFSAENLWTVYNTPEGIDPEIDPADNSGGWGYPNMKQYSLGINISL